MLADHPVDVMLLATDLAVARTFYGDTLGLPVLLEDEQFLTVRCGGDSRLASTTISSLNSPPTAACIRQMIMACGGPPSTGSTRTGN